MASSMLQLLSANCISLSGMASAGMAVSISAVATTSWPVFGVGVVLDGCVDLREDGEEVLAELTPPAAQCLALDGLHESADAARHFLDAVGVVLAGFLAEFAERELAGRNGLGVERMGAYALVFFC